MIKKIILGASIVLVASSAMAQMPPPPVWGGPGPVVIQDNRHVHEDWHALKEAQNRLAYDQAQYGDVVNQQKWAEQHGDYAGARIKHDEASRLYQVIQHDKIDVQSLQQRTHIDQDERSLDRHY